MKRIICSDLHNGNEITDYDRLMAFLDLVQSDAADEFLLLGDIEELLWSNIQILTTVKPYRYVTDKIREIARKKPTKVVLGNHDWNLGLFASQIEPAKIVSPFAEDGIYYTHGHEFDWLSIVTGTPVDPIWWSVALPFVFPTQALLWLATRIWAKSEDTYHWGITLIHEQARAYAEKNGYHTIILAHTHFPVDEIRAGIRLVNCGDMMDSYSYIVEENGIISLDFY